jgi:mRNA interferase HicA
VKRRDLERKLGELGWEFYTEGGNHSIFKKGEKTVAVPRHNEINEYTARGILKLAKGERR